MATRVNVTYITRNALKNIAGVTHSAQDADFDEAIEAGSRYVDAVCNRPSIGGARGGFWYVAAATAVFRPDDALDMQSMASWPALIGDWAAIGTVQTSADGGSTWTSVASTGWQGEPLNASLMDEVFTHVRMFDYRWPSASSYPGRPCLRIIGTLGWGSVPSEVEQASRLAAVRWLHRPNAPFGVAGAGDLGAVYVRGSDPDIEKILARLMWWGD